MPIFLNTGKDYQEHECISTDEAQLRYPELKIGLPRPYEAEGRKLRKMREAARVTMREMAARSASLHEEVGAPLTVCEISHIEMGHIRLADVDMLSLWKKLIEAE